MNPITRNEQFLQGAVNAASGQATGDLPEPITREEQYLNGLVDALENGGGSSLPEVTSADNGKVLKVEDGEWGVGDVSLPFVYINNDDKTVNYTLTKDPFILVYNTGYGEQYYGYLPFFPSRQNSDGTAWLCHVINTDGRLCYAWGKTQGGLTTFYSDTTFAQEIEFLGVPTFLPSDEVMATETSNIFDNTHYGIGLVNNNKNIITWIGLESLITRPNMKTSVLLDMAALETSFNQVISVIKTAASSSAGTTITKYIPHTAEQIAQMTQQITVMDAFYVNQKNVLIKLNNEIFPMANASPDFASMIYKEVDSTNNKIYDIKITFTAPKTYFQCTCHEATSLT